MSMRSRPKADQTGVPLRSAGGLLPTCQDIAERIAAFSRPGADDPSERCGRTRRQYPWKEHMQAEGLGQLYVRLLTANFEEAVAARAGQRAPVFTDEK